MRNNRRLAAEGRTLRMEWIELPPMLRTEIETRLGSAVITSITQDGGFSPGFAARLRCRNKRCFFVKAISATRDPSTAPLYQREAEIVSLLSDSIPAPRLLFTFTYDDWLVLAFEDAGGRTPKEPWHPEEAALVLDAIARFAQEYDPSPVHIERWSELYPPHTWQGWRFMREKGDIQGLGLWVIRHLDKLVDLENELYEAADGDALVHSDLRSDNILLCDERVLFVDWAWAVVAAPWLDLLLFCIPSALQGLEQRSSNSDNR